MKIVSIIKDSFQEFEGYLSLVLFCYNCNLACERCYNLDNVIDSDNIIGDSIELLEKNISPIHDAVVFLGGEPTLWGNDLAENLKFVKNKGLKTKVYTNGMLPKLIENINNKNLVNAYSVDLKCIKNCKEIIGVTITDEKYLKNVDKTIKNIISHNIPIEIRTTKWKNIENIKAAIVEITTINHLIGYAFFSETCAGFTMYLCGKF